MVFKVEISRLLRRFCFYIAFVEAYNGNHFLKSRDFKMSAYIFFQMNYKVLHSTTFDKELSKYPKEFNEWLEKIKDQLMENPYVGNPLRVKWFREKKHDKFRIYYLIYDDLKAVYLVAISAKNDQQRVIDTIWLLLENFKEEIENLLT